MQVKLGVTKLHTKVQNCAFLLRGVNEPFCHFRKSVAKRKSTSALELQLAG